MYVIKILLPMAHDSSNLSTDEVKSAVNTAPKSGTLNFIRQFARTCFTIQGCAVGSIILN